MIGLHPCSISDDFEKHLSIMEEYLGNEKFIAIGEVGIDLYRNSTPLEIQEEVFKIQINWAKLRKLPLVIHVRNSMDIVIKILSQLADDRLRGIIHCFTGTMDQATRILEIGNFKLGIGGILTYKNRGSLEEVVKTVPLRAFSIRN